MYIFLAKFSAPPDWSKAAIEDFWSGKVFGDYS
jgi:hypothetical protein